MKQLFLFLIILGFSAFSVQAQNGSANVMHKGKLMFVNAKPNNAYTVVGKTKFKNSNSNVRAVGADPTGIKKVVMAIDDAIKKVSKGKQEDFQAVIVHSPIKIELINFNEGPITQNTGCTVGTKAYKKKCGTKDIYFLCKPAKDFEEVKIITVKNFTNLGQLKMGKNDIDNFLNKLYERSCKEAKAGVDFDGIFLLADNLVVNGFIQTKEIVLIKYK